MSNAHPTGVLGRPMQTRLTKLHMNWLIWFDLYNDFKASYFPLPFEGNLLVLIAVGRYMKQDVTNILIASMSASDLISTLICVPLQVSLEGVNLLLMSFSRLLSIEFIQI